MSGWSLDHSEPQDTNIRGDTSDGNSERLRSSSQHEESTTHFLPVNGAISTTTSTLRDSSTRQASQTSNTQTRAPLRASPPGLFSSSFRDLSEYLFPSRTQPVNFTQSMNNNIDSSSTSRRIDNSDANSGRMREEEVVVSVAVGSEPSPAGTREGQLRQTRQQPQGREHQSNQGISLKLDRGSIDS